MYDKVYYKGQIVDSVLHKKKQVFHAITSIVSKIFANNEQGIWYDTNDLTYEKISWRRNLLTETEFRNGVTGAPIRGGSVTATSFTGFAGGLQINYNAAGTYAYKTASGSTSKPFIAFSVYIQMNDLSAPIVTDSNYDSAGDFCLVIFGGIVPPNQVDITNIGNNIYRISSLKSTLDPGNYNFGIVKYAGNSQKSFKVTGYQLEYDILTDYQKITDFNTEFINAFPKHTLYQDATGTIPVTAAGQPLGLVLDKSKPILNGQNILSNFLTEDGLVKSNPDISISMVGGLLRISKGAVSPQYVYKAFSCEANKLYRLSVKYKNHTGNNVRFWVRNGSGAGVPPLLSQVIQTFSATDGSGDTLFISIAETHSILIDSQNAAESSVDVESISVVKVSDSINHAYQTTSSMRPLLVASPQRLDYDTVDDKLITNLPSQLTGCTVVRSVPNVGTQILTNQTISTPYNDSTDHCGLIVINRALTTAETAQITQLFNKAAGV